MNFNDGTVDGTLYGGGKLGTTFCYRKNEEGRYINSSGNLVERATLAVPDTSLTLAQAYGDPMKYSYILLNVHGGLFKSNIYAGGAGADKQIVYGLKMLNFENGEVKESVYGGSENVDDGYSQNRVLVGEGPEFTYNGECIDAEHTTLRPSSIVNVTGGTIHSHVYGAGYLGLVHGSTYVNVGLSAIDSCPVWTNTYKEQANAYALFKPGASGGYVPAMTRNALLLKASIYGGANWGDNVGSASFESAGFTGGESRIIVNGSGYNTAIEESLKPEFRIVNSIIGSGTSANGGDVLTRIDVRNYGTKTEDCSASRTLKSIQRADVLWLHNTVIEYQGNTNAAFAYTSQPYALNAIDDVNLRGYNILQLDAQVTNIKAMHFWENDKTYSNGDSVLVVATNEKLNTVVAASHSHCDSDPDITICKKLEAVSPDAPTGSDPEMRHTAILIKNGLNIDLVYEENSTTKYGSVSGYGYLVAPNLVNAAVAARYKIPTGTSGAQNVYDGGFVSTCAGNNEKFDGLDGSGITQWTTEGATNANSEFPYTNYSSAYRVWSLNKGLRRRPAVVVAHATPTELPDQDKCIKVDDASHNPVNLVLAHSKISLPQTTAGHYYMLTQESFVLYGENEDLILVDSAWIPDNWSTLVDDSWLSNVSASGAWETDAEMISGHARLTGVQEIKESPANTFGMIIASGANLNGGMPTGHTSDLPYAVISGTPRVNETGNFCTPKVTGADQVTPELDIFLTYDNSFPHTFLGSVKFTLREYDGNGENVGSDIEIEVIVSTVIKDFRNMSQEVLAMFNEGRTNTCRRKVVLPATLEQRDLYITDVRWLPCENDGDDPDNANSEKFYLDDGGTISGTNNHFGLHIKPTDDVSSTVSSYMGWYSIQSPDINVWNLAKSGTGSDKISDVLPAPLPENYPYVIADTVRLEDPTTGNRGLRMGLLDGRGLAALNIELTFDGSQTYTKPGKKDYVGKVIIGMKSYKANVEQGHFTLTIYVKTRERGDTIYVASAETVTRMYGETPVTLTPYAQGTDDAADEGRSPDTYVRSLRDALSARIYQEGDVIAILDQVTITGSEKVTISGADYMSIPVIRYFGHHSQLPGEKGVYRGPMIVVDGLDAKFTARNIAFDGSALGKLCFHDNETHNSAPYTLIEDRPGNYNDLYADTNEAFGPIIVVKNGGTAAVGHGCSVMHNINNAPSNAASENKGTISVTAGGVLHLWNDLSIAQNFSKFYDGQSCEHPLNGAVYVDGGTVEIAASSNSTAIDITKNYLVPTSSPGAWFIPNKTPNPKRYMVDTTVTREWTKANVFLTRTADTPLPTAIAGNGTKEAYFNAMVDKQSDVITLLSDLKSGSRISVSKWFPGPTLRDTIQIAKSSDGSFLQLAYNNNNLLSDCDYNRFYHMGLSNYALYLQRCATFQRQHNGVQIPSMKLTGSGDGRDLAYLLPEASVPTHDALRYNQLTEASCPTGGDKIIYSVQGGFFPYTYTWESSTSTPLGVKITDFDDVVHSTAYNNKTILDDVKAGNYTKVNDAINDIFQTPHIQMSHSESTQILNVSVTATDLAGCTLKKDLEITLKKTDNGDEIATQFARTGTTTYWTDDVYIDYEPETPVNHKATGNRYFEAIKITPMVWADRSAAIISAFVPYGNDNDTIYIEDDEQHRHDLEGLMFCEGDVIRLHTAPKYGSGASQQRFIMWDFDPYYSPMVNYTVPSKSETVRAYYGPQTYWKDHINTVTAANAAYDNNYYYNTSRNGKSYVTTYHGDVHIYDENGLAWFISVVNGLNGTQARSFFFNSVYLHDKDGGYDMKNYLWTPVGSQQHPFRGSFIGVSGTDDPETALINESDICTTAASTPVVIKNIIIDEPNVDYTGFFGFLDSATVEKIELQGALVRGAQYVGGLAANMVQTKIKDCVVADEDEATSAVTILTTHYASGGMVGKSDRSSITGSTTKAKYVGDAVYNGGVVGYGTATKVYNTGVRNINRMQSVYAGGVAGFLNSGPTSTPASKDANDNDGRSYVMNNYVYFNSQGKNQRAGGLVGYAKNTVIENNYVYGDIAGEATEGGVGAVLDEGSEASSNYYEQGSAPRSVGQHRSNATSSHNTDFSGEGNHVTLSSSNYGVNNLTRALNIWVRAKGDSEFNTWRSDLEHQNDGYPLFGTPDLIPVSDSLLVTGCDSVEWEGQVYLFDEEVISHVIDSVMMIDSTFTLHVLVNHATREQVADSVNVGDAYEGYGFTLSDVEVLMIYRTVGRSHTTTIVLTDTLQTIYGCDSIVTLTLTINPRLGIVEPTAQSRIHVYPNPTTSRVTIEATEAMSQVELYDNQGRRVESFNAHNSNDITIDVSRYSSGAYYLRVHTDGNITIQKLIKK